MQNEAILFFMPEWGGFHPSAWREPEAPLDPLLDFDMLRRIVRKAEAGKFHALFLADALNVGFQGADVSTKALSRTVKGLRGYEPITLLSALAGCTRRIGLLATSSTTYSEPFNVARMFASLDHLSGGRAGWNVVASTSESAARNFGREAHMGHAARYRRAQEFFDVVAGLWDSWEDDAFVRDKEAGVFFDAAKLHALEFQGEYVSSAGPLNIARPPQGHPVIAQAGSSGPGQMFAARNADVVYTLQATLEGARTFYSELKEQVAESGRRPEDVKVLPAMVLVVGRTRAEADERLARLDALVDPLIGIESLEGVLRTDLSDVPLDRPMPEIPETETGSKTHQKYFLDLARRDGLTVRQLMQVAARLSAVAVTPREVADIVQEWVGGGAADGFNITFADSVNSLDVFVEEVVPELQRRGLFHTDYQGRTLRESLGLPRPAHRFATHPSN